MDAKPRPERLRADVGSIPFLLQSLQCKAGAPAYIDRLFQVELIEDLVLGAW